MIRRLPMVQVLLLAAIIVLSGCAQAPAATPVPSLADKAAVEATAIVQRAEATAIVLRAQSTANALIAGASGKTATPVPLPSAAAPATAVDSGTAVRVAVTPEATAKATPVKQSTTASPVELVGVGFAADGGLVFVQFRASPVVARGWNQGNVYVTDEATGLKYNDIPVMPVIGPLIAHPNEEGQLGYVMLVNTGNSLKSGATVTVVLGEFKQEHVPVN